VLRSISADLSLEDALDTYIELRSDLPNSVRYVSPHTQRMDRNHKESLLLFFPDAKLKDIHWEHMRAYQRARLAGYEPFFRYRRPQDAKPTVRGGVVVAPAKGKSPCPCKPQQVNQELATLKKLLTYAGTWTADDAKYYSQLTPREDGIPRSLTPEEQAVWLGESSGRERWLIVHWWSICAIDACMSTNEIDGLRIGDLNLRQQVVTVPWPCAKNPYRKRTISIENAEALWAWDRLLARANDLGAKDPLHYLFPLSDRGRRWEPSLHMTGSGIKRQWYEVREQTGLDWVDRYGMRHTGATRLAENGWPIDMIMARLGHASDEMRQHYTQISVSAQKRWLRNTPSVFAAPQSSPYQPRYRPQRDGYQHGQNFFKKSS